MKPTTGIAPPTAPETLYAAALTAAFTAYRRLLSPVFAASGLGHCRYLPSCSEYAHVALARHGPVRGTLLAAARLARCHPWAVGGLDPVPPAPVPSFSAATAAPATMPANAATAAAVSRDQAPNRLP